MDRIDEQARDEWVQAVEALAAEVELWARRRGWESVREVHDFHEGRLGPYQAPVVTVPAPHAKLILVPVGRFALGCDGRVDLYDWPSFNRLLLKRKSGQWRLHTESGVPWPRAWSEAAFEEVAQLLGEAA